MQTYAQEFTLAFFQGHGATDVMQHMLYGPLSGSLNPQLWPGSLAVGGARRQPFRSVPSDTRYPARGREYSHRARDVLPGVSAADADVSNVVLTRKDCPSAHECGGGDLGLRQHIDDGGDCRDFLEDAGKLSAAWQDITPAAEEAPTASSPVLAALPARQRYSKDELLAIRNLTDISRVRLLVNSVPGHVAPRAPLLVGSSPPVVGPWLEIPGDMVSAPAIEASIHAEFRDAVVGAQNYNTAASHAAVLLISQAINAVEPPVFPPLTDDNTVHFVLKRALLQKILKTLPPALDVSTCSVGELGPLPGAPFSFLGTFTACGEMDLAASCVVLCSAPVSTLPLEEWLAAPREADGTGASAWCIITPGLGVELPMLDRIAAHQQAASDLASWARVCVVVDGLTSAVEIYDLAQRVRLNFRLL